ncbi:MAG: hypothetical protein IT428_06700 [Planctomycetaceae bacterium]|nr:hypothetical protein [Planctomycetaceae bacterium]
MSILKRLGVPTFEQFFLSSPVGQEMLANAEAERVTEHKALVDDIAAAQKSLADVHKRASVENDKAAAAEKKARDALKAAAEKRHSIKAAFSHERTQLENRIATARRRLRELADDRIGEFLESLRDELETLRRRTPEYEYERRYSILRGSFDVAVRGDAESIKRRHSYVLEQYRQGEKLLEVPADKLEDVIAGIVDRTPAIRMEPLDTVRVDDPKPTSEPMVVLN